VDEHSTHLTVDESWGLAPIPPESASGEKFASDMRTLMRETVKKFGSPDKYLQARYGTLSEKQGWVNYLAELQNVNGDQNYSVVADLPVSEMNKLSEGQLLNMHLASFSLSTSASVRGSPENDVVYLLLDEILVDGFVTQGEPLLLTQPADLIAEAEA
ncbi:unnamed protein product, partial [Durusdinium trenchii]